MTKVKSLILLFCTSCASGTYSKYNLSHANKESEVLPFEILDLGVEVLAAELEKADLIPASSTKVLVSHGFLSVHKTTLPFMCGNVKAVSCLNGRGIYLGFKPEFNNCVARTAYLHELTHWIICQRNFPNVDGSVDCDFDHQMTDWWKVADSVAYKAFLSQECPAEDISLLMNALMNWETDWKQHPEVFMDVANVWRR